MIQQNMAVKNLWNIVQPYLNVASRRRSQIGYGFQVLALISMGFALWQSLRMLDLQNIQVNYSLVLTAFGGVFLVVLMGAFNWGLLAIIFRFDGPWLWHVRTHLVANISKYLPGSIWGYLSKGLLSAQTEASKQKIAGALISEMIFALTSGVALVFYTGADAVSDLSIPINLPQVIWMSLVCLTVIVTHLSAHFIVDRHGRPNSRNQLSAFNITVLLFAVMIIFVLGWLLLAFSLSLLVGAVYVQPGGSLNFYVFVFCLSIVLGILTVFVPNGMGVREGILVILLGSIMPLPIAFLMAVSMRIAIIMGEFVAFVFVLSLFALVEVK